jgi:asparagine N-glycosylation enzyme membrane subunit Stt3
VAYIATFPLWWWHFGLPRFKEQGSGFFSPGFCLFGYLAMSASLAVIMLMAFGVIKEGEPHPLPEWFPRSRVIRFLIIFVVLCLYAFFKRKITKKGS